MHEFPTKKAPAPCCGTVIDVTLSTKDVAPPKPGDFSVCSHCGGWLVFTSDVGDLRNFNADDFVVTDDNILKDLRRATQLINEVRKSMGKP